VSFLVSRKGGAVSWQPYLQQFRWCGKCKSRDALKQMAAVFFINVFLKILRFYRATLSVSAVFAVARCLSVRHVGVLYPDG